MSIDNSSWGIQFSASASLFGVLEEVDTNNQITNCVFGANASLGHDLSSGALGINGLGQKDFLISGNTIASIQNLNAEPILPASTSGISLDSCSGEVSGNFINSIEYETTLGSVFGIRTSTLEGETTLIKNNKISGLRRSNFVASTTDPSANLMGIWIFSQNENNGLAKVYNNSIVLTSDEALSYTSVGVLLRGGSTGAFEGEVFNNIIVNTISTTSLDYKAYALVDGNTERGFLLSDYNLLFANGTNGFLGGIGRELGGTEQFTNDLEEFIDLSQTNENSSNFLPEVTDLAGGDLSIPTDIQNPESYLVPTLNEVPLDILGTTRFTPETFVGAYEGSEILSITSSTNANVVIFPNPASGSLKVQLEAPLNPNARVNIINTLGQTVLTVDKANTNNTAMDIDVSALSPGVYILNLDNGGTQFSEKIIIQ